MLNVDGSRCFMTSETQHRLVPSEIIMSRAEHLPPSAANIIPYTMLIITLYIYFVLFVLV